MKDSEFLYKIAEQLVYDYREDPNSEDVLRLRDMAHKTRREEQITKSTIDAFNEANRWRIEAGYHEYSN